MTKTHLSASDIERLRRDVINIQKATATGTKSFKELAQMHASTIFTCRYNEVGNIISDTMSVRYNCIIITEQNLQYFPARVRYYYSYFRIPTLTVTVGKGVSKGEIMRIAYKDNLFNVDSSIPVEDYMRLKEKSIFMVMDYNSKWSPNGQLRHLVEVAASNYINLIIDPTKEGVIYHP